MKTHSQDNILAELEKIPTLPIIEQRIAEKIDAGCISPCNCDKCQQAESNGFYGVPIPDEEIPVVEI